MIRLSMVECLRDRDIRVLEAESGDQAKELFLNLTAIDVVFTDVQMPGLMDGLALAQWLHDVHPEVALLITSGIAQKTELALRWCERTSVFAKPYDEQVVAARIQTLLTGLSAQPA